MGSKAKKEYLNKIRERYKNASKKDKSDLLDELCIVCVYNRKYAIRVLNGKQPKFIRQNKRGPKKQYDAPEILKVINYIWRATNLPCSKRLKEIVSIWLPYYPFKISGETKSKVLNISAATIDRLMKEDRSKYPKIGLATTKPGSLLKKQVPVKTGQWDETRPGYLGFPLKVIS